MMFKKLALFIPILLAGYLSFAQTYPPKSNTLVTDYTNTLSAEDKQRLESKLAAFNDSTSTQIAIVIIKSVGEYDINEYGAGLGRNWGIGQQSKNNGVLILVAIDDHKMTIQTGYGEEGALPDAIAAQIRTQVINPHFKQNDYYGGLDAGTDEIIKYTKGEYKADAKQKAQSQDDSSGGAGGIIVLIIIVIIILIVIFRGRGGGGHIIGSRGGASPFWWFLAGSMLGSSDRSGGWGGFSGGNDSGGGNSGGGGDFGGFGGGDFGGGGSGGSW